MIQLLSTSVRRALIVHAPRTPNQLHGWIRAVLGFDIPRCAIEQGHSAPFDYVEHAYFEHQRPRDCVVWANRGGGKTQLGAIATLLDLLYKPGVQIRILGGSFEQSSKMYGYLRTMLDDDALRDCVKGNFTGRAVELANGARVEVLAQSERSVRGQRVHKLRCDEIELFDDDIWTAAQLVTRSGMCGNVFVPAAIEAMSTMHRPFGLMQRLVNESESGVRRIFRWSVLETLERCHDDRACNTCALWPDCRGRAKLESAPRGFLHIDDAVQQRNRIGAGIWKAEMLCARPTRTDTVYPEFDPAIHIRNVDPATFSTTSGKWIGGIDFGYRAPTVLLWAFHESESDIVSIIDELVVREQTTYEIIRAASAQSWPRPEWIGADPAGHQRSEHTGRSTIALWKDAGWSVRTRSFRIEPGIMAVRARLKRASGEPALFIHPRCVQLIQAITKYHYPPHETESSAPVKDGDDHAADALRYLIINLDRGETRLRGRNYLTGARFN